MLSINCLSHVSFWSSNRANFCLKFKYATTYFLIVFILDFWKRFGRWERSTVDIRIAEVSNPVPICFLGVELTKVLDLLNITIIKFMAYILRLRCWVNNPLLID